jgi:protein O-mannosyl-transferase
MENIGAMDAAIWFGRCAANVGHNSAVGYTVLEPMKRRNRSKLGENTSSASLGKSVPNGGEHSPPSARSAGTSFGRPILLAAGLIVLATVLAYSNTFRCPLVFDDASDIINNTSICHLWPIRDVFVVQRDGRSVLHSRPVVNFSLAVNYAVGGLKPFPYHVTNLLIHVLAGLTLFGIVRRTLLLPGLGGRFTAAATSLALAVALIWALHPLQTQAVTYVVQRYESMMGLFYLLALYAAVRCGTSQNPGRWAVVSVAAVLLALGCKEVAVSIPITILLYDRAFLAGSFREAWRRRPWLYVGLAAAWVPFALLLWSSSGRSNWSGYGLPVTWIEYARSQFGVILHYLRMTFWPCPLVLDYRWPVARTVDQIVPAAVVIGGLAAATGYALIRWPKWGFLGAWFFLILAPTSSVLPLLDLAVEHRMYLPLAAVVAGVVVGGYLVGRWIADRERISRPALQVVSVSLVIIAGVVLGILTFERNVDYRSELSIWEDTVAKAPSNERAHDNLGNALIEQGRVEDAIAQYEKAIELGPNSATSCNNFGAALTECGRLDEAVIRLEKALKIRPDYADAHINLGIALTRSGRTDEAIAHLNEALAINADSAQAHNNLGIALDDSGRVDEAAAHYRKALEIKPDFADAHNNLGNALAGRGQLDEAIAHYEKSLRANPNRAEAHYNMGDALFGQGRPDAAIAHYQKALYLKPDYVNAHNNLGVVLASRRQWDEAIVLFRKALEIKPDYADARKNLGLAQSQREGMSKMLAQRRESLRSHPDDIALLNEMAWVLATNPNASIRNGAEALELAGRAVQLSDGREPAVLGTLAAAYAETQRFSEALQTAHKAADLAARQNNQPLAESIRVKIQLYEAGTPFREIREK